jgi:hypothetical protein
MAELTENEIATINAILQQQAGGAMTDQEAAGGQVQPQNFGALPKNTGGAMTDAEMAGRQMPQGGTPYNMSTEQGKAQYLQQQIEAIKSRMGGGGPQTGSQRVMQAMGSLPQTGGAMTPQEMQQLQMMRGQR